MLQTYSASQPSFYEDRSQGFDLGYVIATARRRIFYFAIPFIVILIAGVLLVVIQRPIYQAAGKILVESPQIPTDLVEPTVTTAATERIQVIEQRLTSRDNLEPIMNKFKLFPTERKWMSGTELLDLMRERLSIQLLDIDSLLSPAKDGKSSPLVMRPNNNNKNSAIAFTVTFDYENPQLAAGVANELLTSILNSDVQGRTNRAAETTQFLAEEVKRQQEKLDALDAGIATIRKNAADPTKGSTDLNADQLKTQTDELTKLKADLVKASSVYSDAHPTVKALKRRVEGLEKEISLTANPPINEADKNLFALTQQRTSLGKTLDEANAKLTSARLGESMERNQQSEHLQVIEQPVVPQKPIKPNKIKLFAIVFALAAASGVGCLVLAEMLDKSIRNASEIAAVVDSHLVVVLPYITTTGEVSRRRRRIIMLWATLGVLLVAGLAAAFYIGIEIDVSWFDRSWIDSITRLTK